jgi:hypothetical protein
MKTKKSKTPKRLDGKKILVARTARMEKDMRSFCREKGIESENELVRQAIVKYIDGEYDDETLKLSGLKDIKESISQLKDMISVLFSYQHLMHLNLLAYFPEIDESIKDAALSSATVRHERFYAGFQDRLRNDPPFFERLLHKFVTGDLE